MQWLNLVTELCELYCAVQINGLLRESVQKLINDLENSIKYSENYRADLLLRIASIKLLGWGTNHLCCFPSGQQHSRSYSLSQSEHSSSSPY